MRILVAEDDDMIGESLVAFLESEDYAVDWVRDGPVSYTHLRAHET